MEHTWRYAEPLSEGPASGRASAGERSIVVVGCGAHSSSVNRKAADDDRPSPSSGSGTAATPCLMTGSEVEQSSPWNWLAEATLEEAKTGKHRGRKRAAQWNPEALEDNDEDEGRTPLQAIGGSRIDMGRNLGRIPTGVGGYLTQTWWD